MQLQFFYMMMYLSKGLRMGRGARQLQASSTDVPFIR